MVSKQDEERCSRSWQGALRAFLCPLREKRAQGSCSACAARRAFAQSTLPPRLSHWQGMQRSPGSAVGGEGRVPQYGCAVQRSSRPPYLGSWSKGLGLSVCACCFPVLNHSLNPLIIFLICSLAGFLTPYTNPLTLAGSQACPPCPTCGLFSGGSAL